MPLTCEPITVFLHIVRRTYLQTSDSCLHPRHLQFGRGALPQRYLQLSSGPRSSRFRVFTWAPPASSQTIRSLRISLSRILTTTGSSFIPRISDGLSATSSLTLLTTRHFLNWIQIQPLRKLSSFLQWQ